jgi:hypothetical protein
VNSKPAMRRSTQQVTGDTSFIPDKMLKDHMNKTFNNILRYIFFAEEELPFFELEVRDQLVST